MRFYRPWELNGSDAIKKYNFNQEKAKYLPFGFHIATYVKKYVENYSELIWLYEFGDGELFLGKDRSSRITRKLRVRE